MPVDNTNCHPPRTVPEDGTQARVLRLMLATHVKVRRACAENSFDLLFIL